MSEEEVCLGTNHDGVEASLIDFPGKIELRGREDFPHQSV
jgi:hypothetical protein